MGREGTRCFWFPFGTQTGLLQNFQGRLYMKQTQIILSNHFLSGTSFRSAQAFCCSCHARGAQTGGFRRCALKPTCAFFFFFFFFNKKIGSASGLGELAAAGYCFHQAQLALETSHMVALLLSGEQTRQDLCMQAEHPAARDGRKVLLQTALRHSEVDEPSYFGLDGDRHLAPALRKSGRIVRLFFSGRN